MFSLSISTTYKLLLFSPASSSFSKFRVQNPRSSLSFPYHKPTKPRGLLLPVCEAKSRTAPLKKRSSSSSSSSAKKKKKPTKGRGGVADLDDFEIVKSDVDGGSYTYDYDDGGEGSVRANANSGALTRHPVTPLPNPPAGFILDEAGKVVLASTKRIATIASSDYEECQRGRVVSLMKKLKLFFQLWHMLWQRYICILYLADSVIQQGEGFATQKMIYLISTRIMIKTWMGCQMKVSKLHASIRMVHIT